MASVVKPIMYWNKICPFVHRAWIVAVEKAAPVELFHISLGDDMPAWYEKEVNPRGTVPALKLPSGKILHESMFIAEYLDATYGTKNALSGCDPVLRAKISAFVAQIGDLIGSMYGLLIDNNAENLKSVRENLQYVEKLFAAQNDGLGPFFLGATFSMADVALVPFLIRFNATLKAYCGFDLAAEAPWADKLRRAALQRHSVASTNLSPEFYIDSYSGYAKRESAYPKGRLYVALACPYAHRARIAAAYKGLLGSVVVEEAVQLPTPESYAAINPARTVPAFVTPAGELIQESGVVVTYLNDAYKGVGEDIVPADEALVAQAKLFVSEFGNFWGGVFKFFGAAPGEEKEKLRAELKSDGAYIETMLGETCGEAGPWVLGSAFSFADAAVLPFLIRLDAAQGDARMTGNYDFFGDHPRLRRLLDAGKADARIASTFLPPVEYNTSMKGFLGI